MKRQKEINNLIENIQQNICDNCRRWNGDFYENNSIDTYKCKYNTDNKGLYNGLCINHPENYKCKYFKRNSKYITCRFEGKHYSTHQGGVKIKEVKWVRGKFKDILDTRKVTNKKVTNGYIIEKDFIIDGYRCVIVGQKHGHRCGYIEIPEGHLLYGKYYDDVTDLVGVHGGWTYSEFTRNNYPVVTNKNSWWIGFDCGHWNDGKDLELVKLLGDERYIKHCIEINNMYPETMEIRTAEYVENELIEAVKQINNL